MFDAGEFSTSSSAAALSASVSLNKRARWKSKQLERDYSILRVNYDNLASQQYESLKKKNSLIQLQKLNDVLQKEGGKYCCRQEINSIGFEPDNRGDDGTKNKEIDGRPSLSFDLSEHGANGVISDDDSSIKADYLGLDEECNSSSTENG
ncbi:hypothetical protein HAX54_000525 [Datura stramonium]|uniref:Homeobox-leucine zipper protein n=1 Tax=Datura stramonium TaxID=4076 RepID=A0ABS8WSZ6_DATST|nr:hypothetical protein [Datura stramonium]